jgi:hypothetical protein
MVCEFLPIEGVARFTRNQPPTGELNMGKGNNSQKNDKKNLKPKQDKTKPAPKK